jgi:Protein of unknown function (DUF3575)
MRYIGMINTIFVTTLHQISQTMKKMLFAGLLFFALAAAAQDGPKVVVFNSTTENNEPGYWSKDNLVKFSVMEAFSGDFSFYYERLLTENFSAEIGMGPTLSNYISTLWTGNNSFSDDSYQALMGFSFFLGARYYPYRAADEFYVAPEFKYRMYHNNRTYQDLMGVDMSMEESSKTAMGRLTFGYVYFFDNNIFMDLSAGFGIGKISKTELGWEVNDQGYNEPFEDVSSTLAPKFHLGLKIGVAF